MSKEHSLSTIRLDGKKHSILRETEPILYLLEGLEGVKKVGIGTYGKIRRNVDSPRLEVLGYDSLMNSFHVKYLASVGMQKFFVQIQTGLTQEQRRDLEEKINGLI